MTKTQSSRFVPILAFSAAVGFTAHCGNKNTPNLYRGQSGSEVVNNGNGSAGSESGNGGSNVTACPCGGLDGPGQTALLHVTLLTREQATFESESFPWCRTNTLPAGFNELRPECARLRLRVEEVLLSDVSLQQGDEMDVVSDGYLPCFLGLDAVPAGSQALAFVSWGSAELPQREPSARLAPWSESIVFAKTDQGQLAVPADELPEALVDEACPARFGNWSDVPGAFPDGNIP
jgi:hypothetical protein